MHALSMKPQTRITSLQDLLQYHQDALLRHQKLFEKHGIEHARYPKWAARIQRADQCKIDFHQQSINVMQAALTRLASYERQQHAAPSQAESALA